MSNLPLGHRSGHCPFRDVISFSAPMISVAVRRCDEVIMDDGWMEWVLMPHSTSKVISWQTLLVVEESSDMPKETTDLRQVTVQLPHMESNSRGGGQVVMETGTRFSQTQSYKIKEFTN